MIFKNIERIRTTIPEIQHIAMFYDDGTVFFSTFESSANIPKLGENLAEMLQHGKNLEEHAKIPMGGYTKLIYETDDTLMVVFKLGESSNIALFLKNVGTRAIKFTAIKKYLDQIEELVDMDQEELEEFSPL